LTSSPLSGKRVVVTRARTQSTELVARLEGLGATVVELPVIAIEDPVDGGEALAGAVHRLSAGAYQWVVVTSSNAVTRLLALLDPAAVPPTVRWAAVGAGTARALGDGGIVADLVPTVAVSEALAEEFPAVDPLGPEAPAHGPREVGTVLFPRAETVRGELASGLRAKGWLVDEVIAYRTAPGSPGPDAVAAARDADAVVFTSSSTVERTIEVLGRDRLPPVILSIGPVTSRSVRAAGLEVAAEASPHTVDGVVDALAALAQTPGDARWGRGQRGPQQQLQRQHQQQQQQ
jgi:uroporphyrinogen-III synthase